MHVDYIGYGSPKFGGDDEYFNEIFAYVNEKHHIDINSRSLTDSPAYSISFELIFKDKTHSFSLGEGAKKEGEGDKKEGGGEKKDGGGVEKKEDEDYEENDAMKQGRIPKFSRKDSILCKLYPRYSRYCSFYLNFDELKDIPRDFEKRDLIEFLFFLKKKGTKIFLNFYQPQDKEEKKEEDLGNKNKDNKIAGEAYDSSGNQKEKEAEKEKQNEEEDEEGETKEEREMKDLNNLYYLTDLYFFENKQAINEFDKHYKFFTSDKDKEKKKLINKNYMIIL